MGWKHNPLECFSVRYEVSPETMCWQWRGAPIKRGGYGVFTHRPSGMIMVRAHRAAWMLMVGDIPTGLHVLHRCDNRLCVNPEHLFLGQQQDNMTDKVKKGRQNRGTSHGLHKLSDEDVFTIRSSSERGSRLAKRFGVSHSTICDIRARRSWAHI
jgi:hypothetical protein